MDEWRSTLIPIYKKKGPKELKLMSHTMKLWGSVIEQRLREETHITKNQFGFTPGNGLSIDMV